MTYRAVIFDLFGTLVHQFPASGYADSLEDMAEAVGIDFDTFHRAWVHDTWRERAIGTFHTIGAAVDYICRTNGVRPTPQQLEKATQIRYAFTRTALRPRDDAISTLRALKTQGLLLGLISDCTPEVPDLWPETPFAGLIDVPIFSSNVGTKKPDPHIYRMACEGLGVEPQECIYVGDGSSRELQGASALGMLAILIAPPHEERADPREWEGTTWAGERITALEEVLRFIAH